MTGNIDAPKGGICFELQDIKDIKSHIKEGLDSTPTAYVHLKVY